MALEIIFHKVLGELASIAETLKTTVHIASIAKIFEPNNSFPTSEVFFLKVKLLEGDWPSTNVFLFKLTLSLMVFPVLLQTFYGTILSCSTLAKLEIFCLVASFVAAFLCFGSNLTINFLSFEV